MDGDWLPASLLELARQYDAWLVVDDAHGLQVSWVRKGRETSPISVWPSTPAFDSHGHLGRAAGVAGLNASSPVRNG